MGPVMKQVVVPLRAIRRAQHLYKAARLLIGAHAAGSIMGPIRGPPGPLCSGGTGTPQRGRRRKQVAQLGRTEARLT